MKGEQTDRRIRRTRRVLHNALMSLVIEKRYDKITVQDILDRADVGRSTFYTHFQDKDDLLVQGLAMFSENLNTHIEGSDHGSGEGEHLLHSLTFFRHADMHHELYRAMQEGGGADVIMEAGRRHLTQDIQNHLGAYFSDRASEEIPLPLITNFLAGAMLSVLMWWLDADRPCSPEEVNEIFQQLAMDGVSSMLPSHRHRTSA